MIERVIVVQTWQGPVTVARVAPDGPEPTIEELDEIAVAWLPWCDGALPTVRVLEVAKTGWPRGAAGTVPRG